MKAVVVNSLFGPIDSLFGETDSLFRSAREFGCNALELLRELMAAIAEAAANTQIPCCFPCIRGFMNCSAISKRCVVQGDPERP
jgi:hypothetical protein